MQNDIKNNIYPLNTIANGTDNVYIGRIRRDYSVENGLNFWCVADNIRKGAATNAIQIIEKLMIIIRAALKTAAATRKQIRELKQSITQVMIKQRKIIQKRILIGT